MNGLRGVVLRRKRRGQRGEQSHGGCADRIHGCGYDTAVQNGQTSPLPFLTENSSGARAGIGAPVPRKEDARLLTGEIGRASCRERVSIAGGAVTGRKN